MFGQSILENMTRDDWVKRLPDLTRQMGWNGKLLVVTLAEAGCVALNGAGPAVSQPAYRIRQIDATGAGDAFGC